MKTKNLSWQIDLFTEKNWIFYYESERNHNILQAKKENESKKEVKIIQNYNSSFPHNALDHKQKSEEFHGELARHSENFSQIRSEVQDGVNLLQNSNNWENFQEKNITSHNPENNSPQKISEKTEENKPINSEKNKTKTTKKPKEKITLPKDRTVIFSLWRYRYEMKFSKNDNYLYENDEVEWVTIKMRPVGGSAFMRFEVGLQLPKFSYITLPDGSPSVVCDRFGQTIRVMRTDRWNERRGDKFGNVISNFQYFAYSFNVPGAVEVQKIITNEIWDHCRQIWIMNNPHPYYDK